MANGQKFTDQMWHLSTLKKEFKVAIIWWWLLIVHFIQVKYFFLKQTFINFGNGQVKIIGYYGSQFYCLPEVESAKQWWSICFEMIYCVELVGTSFRVTYEGVNWIMMKKKQTWKVSIEVFLLRFNMWHEDYGLPLKHFSSYKSI